MLVTGGDRAVNRVVPEMERGAMRRYTSSSISTPVRLEPEVTG